MRGVPAGVGLELELEEGVTDRGAVVVGDDSTVGVGVTKEAWSSAGGPHALAITKSSAPPMAGARRPAAGGVGSWLIVTASARASPPAADVLTGWG